MKTTKIITTLLIMVLCISAIGVGIYALTANDAQLNTANSTVSFDVKEVFFDIELRAAAGTDLNDALANLLAAQDPNLFEESTYTGTLGNRTSHAYTGSWESDISFTNDNLFIAYNFMFTNVGSNNATLDFFGFTAGTNNNFGEVGASVTSTVDQVIFKGTTDTLKTSYSFAPNDTLSVILIFELNRTDKSFSGVKPTDFGTITITAAA